MTGPVAGVMSVCLSVCLSVQEALGLIEPLLADPTNFVRQSALIASALILIQQTEAMNPKVAPLTPHFSPTHSPCQPHPHPCFGWCR